MYTRKWRHATLAGFIIPTQVSRQKRCINFIVTERQLAIVLQKFRCQALKGNIGTIPTPASRSSILNAFRWTSYRLMPFCSGPVFGGRYRAAVCSAVRFLYHCQLWRPTCGSHISPI